MTNSGFRVWATILGIIGLGSVFVGLTLVLRPMNPLLWVIGFVVFFYGAVTLMHSVHIAVMGDALKARDKRVEQLAARLVELERLIPVEPDTRIKPPR